MSESKDIHRMLTAASEGAVDAQDRQGNRAINQAAKAGHVDVVMLLLDHGANVNEPDGMGRTPLIACAEGDHTQLVELLLEAGADAMLPDSSGLTPLALAHQYADEIDYRQMLTRPNQ
jgi:ankyrin repeat protein